MEQTSMDDKRMSNESGKAASQPDTTRRILERNLSMAREKQRRRAYNGLGSGLYPNADQNLRDEDERTARHLDTLYPKGADAQTADEGAFHPSNFLAQICKRLVQ